MRVNNSIKSYKEQSFSKIKNSLSGELFQDSHFLPNDQALGTKVTTTFPHVNWKRPQEIWPNAQFLPHSFEVKLTTRAGNWSIPSALYILASAPKLLYQVLGSYNEKETDNGEINFGIYCFNLWFGCWYSVVVDDYLPTSDGFLFTHSYESFIIWPALVEKALAKLLGSYELLLNLDFATVLTLLTGGIVCTEVLGDHLHDRTYFEQLYKFLLYQLHLGNPLACWISPTNLQAQQQVNTNQRNQAGLCLGLIYSITSVHKAKPMLRKLPPLYMAKLKQTWSAADKGDTKNAPGTATGGEWCYDTDFLTRRLSLSSQWSTMDAKTKRKLGLTNLKKDELWVTLEDFEAQFDHLYTWRTFQKPTFFHKKSKGYNYVLEGHWKSGVDHRLKRAPENPESSTPIQSEFLQPQYMFDVTKDKQEVWLFLMQTDSFSDLLPITIHLIKVEENRMYRVHSRQEQVLLAPCMELKSTTVHATLHRGRYIVLPGTLGSNHYQRRHFLLRVSSPRKLEVRELIQEAPTIPSSFFKRVLKRSSIKKHTTLLTIRSIQDLEHSVSRAVLKITCGKMTTKTPIKSLADPACNLRYIFYHPSKAVITIKLYRHRFLWTQLVGYADIAANVTSEPQRLRISLTPTSRPRLMLQMEIWTHATILRV